MTVLLLSHCWCAFATLQSRLSAGVLTSASLSQKRHENDLFMTASIYSQFCGLIVAVSSSFAGTLTFSLIPQNCHKNTLFRTMPFDSSFCGAIPPTFSRHFVAVYTFSLLAQNHHQNAFILIVLVILAFSFQLF